LSFGTAWTTEQSELPIRCVPTNVQGIIFRSDQGVWVFVDSYPLPLQPSSGAGTHLVPASCRGRWFPITATRMGSDWLGIPGKNDEGFFSDTEGRTSLRIRIFCLELTERSGADTAYSLTV
jgi:hypothetical protein